MPTSGAARRPGPGHARMRQSVIARPRKEWYTKPTPRMCHSMLPARAVAFCLLVSVVRAQTAVHVVAPVAGPGVDFTTIAAAVAAADDGDTVLLRSANYPAFG